MKKTTNFIISYGLPGSGKTTLFKKLHNDTYNSRYVSVDTVSRRAKSNGRTLEQYLEGELVCYHDKAIVFVDGLFTTNNDLINLIDIIKKANPKYEKTLSFTVHYWNEDREACIWNDEYRRDETSIATIKTLPYETPDKDLLLEKTGFIIDLIAHDIIRKEEYVHDANNLGFSLTDKYLVSDSWSNGGTVCNCWGDRYTSYASEPTDFTALDEFLELKKPNLTFLQYKRIWRECVTTHDYDEGDYYGGCINYMYYKCDMEKLYKILEEL